MEGQVTLSISEYQKLVAQADSASSLEYTVNNLTCKYLTMERKYNELKLDVIYEKERYYIKDIAETNDSYSREKLFNDLVERFEFDSIKEINKTIEELVEKFKKEKENEKENVSD